MTAILVQTPSGSEGSIQFKKSGKFTGSSKFVFDVSNSRLGVTGSAIFGAASSQYSNKLPPMPGNDTVFFVSGSVGSRGTSAKGTSVFGGDVVVSGTLYAERQVIEVDEVTTGHLMVSGTIYGTGTLGPAEDSGAYTDGLFTDFTNNTHIGTAVDRFNEILKALSPSPAPNLDDIGCADTGASGKLSFGSSNAVSGFTNVSATGNHSAVDMNGSYTSAASSNDLRRGLFDGSTVINGNLNDDVTADGINYGADAFGEGKAGFVVLQLNGSNILSASLSVNSHPVVTSSAGGSVLTIYSASEAAFTDGTRLDVFMHRSGTYAIAASDQSNGLNHVRVIHRQASAMSDTSSDVTTNYVEWVNDNDSNALATAAGAFDTLAMTGDKRISGVKYHTAGSAQYRVRVTNAYKNVYTTSNITFTDTNCTIAAQAMPSIGGSEDETKVLHLTGSATISANSLLNESISAAVNVSHPLKSNLSSGESESITGLLMWGYSNSSTVLKETFRAENYRIISGSYTTQASIVHDDNEWDGTKHMSGSNAGHADGLMFYNQRLYAPNQGANSSNFSGISNGPTGNVNYSGISSGTRTFYRYFQNNSGGSKTGFSLVINGSGTIVAGTTALNSSRIHVFTKISETSAGQSTGFMDLASAFSTGQVGDGDGCLEGSLDSSLNATNTVTFGTQFIADDEYVVLKIEAGAAYTGYISQITVSWS